MENPYISNVSEIKENFKRNQLKKIKKIVRTGRVLEVGCAGGAVLKAFCESGFNKVVGVELNEEIAHWGRENLGVNILNGILENQNFSNAYFDIIYAGDLIEHLKDPLKFLEEVNRILKPKGILVLDFPMEINNFSGHLHRLFSDSTKCSSKPYHLYYYNMFTIEKLLKYNNFIVKVKSERKIINLSSIFDISKRNNIFDYKLFKKFTIDLFNLLFTKLFRKYGDRGFIIASKRGE